MSQRLLRAAALAALLVFLSVSWLQYAPSQWPAPVTWRALLEAPHACGPLGLAATHGIVLVLGRFTSIVVPILMGLVTVAWVFGFKRRRTLRLTTRLLGSTLLAVVVSEQVAGTGAGGLLGRVGLDLLHALLGGTGATILLGGVLALVLLRTTAPLVRSIVERSDGVREWAQGAGAATRTLWFRLVEDVRDLWRTSGEIPDGTEELVLGRIRTGAQVESASWDAREMHDKRPESPPRILGAQRAPRPRVVELGATTQIEADEPLVRSQGAAHYQLPSLDLLHPVAPPVSESASDAELLEVSRRLEEKLADFGIGGRVSEVQPGPVITTYEFEPAAGIKVSQVTSRVDDLAMALRAQSIRMVAPIPGKAAIGVEIPNHESQLVTLREIVEAWTDDLRVGSLGLALGKTVSGEPFFADLAAMPHLLVAGATGSGKSVCIQVILSSLLLRHDPNAVKLLLIDPKMLELNAYKDIPHLLHPVVTDPKEAYKALHWLTAEMERRYRELARAGVRNIQGYNKKLRAGTLPDEAGESREVLPYVVVVIDELADLMIQVGSEIETPIARLAQMARAVGIHLVVATQRPSVDVLTGVIKANFPSRIAFQVPSRVDSRTILDTNGAEALLGRGDMLFLPGGRPAPIRLHGAFASLEECEKLADHWRQFGQRPGALDLDAGRESQTGETAADDALFDQARNLVVGSGVGSVSYLQRRLKVGYSRAARIMDMLEDAGVVGPAAGAKGRAVLERPQDFPPLPG